MTYVPANISSKKQISRLLFTFENDITMYTSVWYDSKINKLKKKMLEELYGSITFIKIQKKDTKVYTGILKNGEMICLVKCEDCERFLNHINQKHLCVSRVCDVNDIISYKDMLKSIVDVICNESKRNFKLNSNGYEVASSDDIFIN